MAEQNLMPLAGINTVAEDAALQVGGDSPRLYVRDAVNFDITPAGRATLRATATKVSASAYKNLWQSPLHGDTFGTLGADWVKINTSSWAHEVLASIGQGDASHEILNNQVCVAGPAGIFTYDGAQARRLTIENPGPPLVTVGSGSLAAGTYGVAVAWLRSGMESATSGISFVDVPDGGALEITLPMCLDPSADGARLYLTQPNGGELARAGDYSIGHPTITIPLLPNPGRPAQFQHLSSMPTGRYLKYWRGRLMTAKANVLRWSESLAYHLHSERHGFIQMPQRITFVQPVDGGIWVGQVDHVAFLSGQSPDSLELVRKRSRAPVPGSAVLVEADVIGGELSQGGAATAIWLAENGYVAGTASGALVELQSGVMSGIAAQSGTSVVLERRLITAVS